MYIVYRRDHYKLCFCLGMILCSIVCPIIYLLIVVENQTWNFLSFMSLFISIAYTSLWGIQLLRKSLDFVVLRIDENGLFLCSKKNEGIFVSWEKIKYVIFVIDDYGSKIVVRQHNKDTHYLSLTDYFNCLRPKNAIKAAYEYADNKEKIREVKDSIALNYEAIMWRISKTEVNHGIGSPDHLE